MQKTETIHNIDYLIGKLSAFEQLHVARRLAPVLAELFTSFKATPEGGEAGLDALLELASVPLAKTLAKMTNEDVDYVVNACLSVCQRQQAKGWARVMVNGVLMFADIELDTLIALTSSVVQENLGRFFPTSQPESATAE